MSTAIPCFGFGPPACASVQTRLITARSFA